MKLGDTFTIAGHYKRRTFWQWLTNQPKELQQYRVTGDYTCFTPYEAVS